MRHALVASGLLAAFALLASCRDPTEIVVAVSTDASCNDIQGVSFATGSLGDALENKPASTVSMTCDPATGHLGTVVLVPSGSDDQEVDFRVTAGFGQSVEACKSPFGPGCIVARRALRYIPSTKLYVPIELSVACNGIPCTATETCRDGACVDPHVDPQQCKDSSGCDVGDGGTPPVDAGPDATPDAGTPIVTAITKVGDVPAETGTSMQQHILRTKNGGYYWFFYYDSANTKVLQPMRSSDFVTWNLGAGLGITGDTGNEGRDFSVAYADVSGHDVIHFVGSHQNNGIHGAYHFGVELSGPSIQGYAGETLVTSTTFFLSPAEPDGPAIAVGSDHNVTLATGWFNQNGLNGHNFDTVANMDVYQSTSPDTGSGNAGTPGAERLHHWVSTYVNNRALVALDSGKVLAVWPEADDASAPDSSDLSWAWSGDGWQDPTTRLVFGAVSPTATNDWAVCGVTPTVVHAVRRKVDSSANDTFDDMVFDASNGAWSPGASIPTQPGIYGTGVALVTNGSHMLLFSVASDGHNSIVYTRFDGTSWSAWQTLVGGSAKRAFLSGSGCANRDHAMITWTEGAAAPYTVMGAEVTSLL